MKLSGEKQDSPWWEVIAKLTPLIIGLGVTGVATYSSIWFQSEQNKLNQIRALDDFRALLTSEDATERAFAYEAFVALGYEDIAVKLIRAADDPAGRAALGQMVAAQSQASMTAKAALDTIPVRVFIHIANERQRSLAWRLTSSIRDTLEYRVLPIDNIEDEAAAPQSPEVRFFNRVDQEAAERIQQILIDAGLSDARTAHISFLKARPGTVEIWLPGS